MLYRLEQMHPCAVCGCQRVESPFQSSSYSDVPLLLTSNPTEGEGASFLQRAPQYKFTTLHQRRVLCMCVARKFVFPLMVCVGVAAEEAI